MQNNPATAAMQETAYQVRSDRLNGVALPTLNDMLQNAFTGAGIERQIGQPVGHPATGSSRGIASNNFKNNPKLFANNRS
jgi:hypothetical protein